MTSKRRSYQPQGRFIWSHLLSTGNLLYPIMLKGGSPYSLKNHWVLVLCLQHSSGSVSCSLGKFGEYVKHRGPPSEGAAAEPKYFFKPGLAYIPSFCSWHWDATVINIFVIRRFHSRFHACFSTRSPAGVGSELQNCPLPIRRGPRIVHHRRSLADRIGGDRQVMHILFAGSSLTKSRLLHQLRGPKSTPDVFIQV